MINQPTKSSVGRAALIAAACAAAVPCVQFAEGTVYNTYLDPVKIVTECTGHTEPGLKLTNAPIPKAKCDALLNADLLRHGNGVYDCLKVEPPVKTLAAFTSFGFNVGVRAFCTSTMARKANAGDWPGACAEMPKWVRGGGRVLPGLIRRRTAERALCDAGWRP